MWDTRRAARADAGSIESGTRTQLAMFRDLRRARRHAADLAAQLAQAKKAAEQQRCEHDQERQGLQASLAAARQQSARLEADLSDAKTRAEAQTEANAQNTERMAAEQHRAMARIGELERAACIAAASHHEAVEQLQDTLRSTQQQLAAADAAVMTTERRRQDLDSANKELDAESKRNTVILVKLAALWTSTVIELEEHKRKLTQEQQQTATERQQSSTLRANLHEAMITLYQQRDQLDRTGLSLTKLRAAGEPQVYTAKIEKLNADLAAVQKELTSRTEERDSARVKGDNYLKLVAQASLRLHTQEEELSTQKELATRQQNLMDELHEKTNKLYDRVLQIKQKKDWRL